MNDSLGKAESLVAELESEYRCRGRMLNTSLALFIFECGVEKCDEGCDKKRLGVVWVL